LTSFDRSSLYELDSEGDKGFLADRIRFLYIAGLIGIASSVSMTIIEFYRNEFFRVIPSLLFSVIAPFLLLSLYLKEENYKKILTGFATLILFQQIMGAFTSFNEVLMLIWYPVFPLTYFFLLGYQQALIWNSVALTAIIAGYLCFPFFNHIPAVSFPIFLSSVFAYCVAMMLAWYHYRVIYTYQSRLKRETLIDSLTGSLLRKAGIEQLSRLMSQSDKVPDLELFVALMDIDNFKIINDQDGHQAGDRVLISVADSVHRFIRNQDSFVRLGGEEFLLILWKKSFNAAYTLAEDIRKQIAEDVRLTDGSSVTVSIGLTQYRPGETLGVLLRRADNLMYDAKKRGKNRTCCLEPVNEDSLSSTHSQVPVSETV